MEELVLLSLLIKQYKLTHNTEELPKGFDLYSVDEKIKIISQALENDITVEEVDLKQALNKQHKQK